MTIRVQADYLGGEPVNGMFHGGKPSGVLNSLRIDIDRDSIINFIELVQRALNCWDDAPKELKELGDMVTHGYITQDHTVKKMTRTEKITPTYSPEEELPICEYCGAKGEGHYHTCPALLREKSKS